MTRPVFHRVLLVGFMGAGKSTVGRQVASYLGWRFVDFDDAIEAGLGMPVSQIFERHGESAFRAEEMRVSDRLLSENEVVLASGGGWAAAPGRLTSLPEGTVSVWLDVSAEEAVRRVSAEPGRRPLLAGTDPVGAAKALLSERRSAYADARWRVDTERSTVEDVSARILRLLAGVDIDQESE